MLNTILVDGVVDTQGFLICTAVSVVLGLLASLVYMFRNTYSKSFVITVVLLPAIVQMVIMLVNGNLGTGVAVMGAFSLVRFRSVPGTAREITAIFLAMAIGLATGMGYIGMATIMFVIVGAVQTVMTVSSFGERRSAEKELKITIPESLDYTEVFDDLFLQYTRSNELVKVKTSNMGSLYELHYHISLKDRYHEKAFIDELRCRNGNLNISCGRVPEGKDQL